MANERNALTDDELVLDFVRGDELAFEELVLRYKNSLYQSWSCVIRTLYTNIYW